MKGTKLWIAVTLVVGVVVISAVLKSRNQAPAHPGPESRSGSTPKPTSNTGANQVPAHYEAPPALRDLPPILAPSQFAGKTREAYEAVKQNPITIAQMPCYCHCDRGMGHKSLHSCFEDDHAAHCATCVDEALIAYRLQREGLSDAQIRERIIAQYSEK
jgi:hypothetical protein